MSGLTDYLPGGTTSALAVFVATLLIGWVLDQVLYRFLRSRTVAAGWRHGQELAAGLHGLPTAVGALLGAHLALQRVHLSPALAANAATAVRLLSILVATGFAARVIGRIVRSYTEREGSRLPSTSIFVNLARGLVWTLGLVSLLGALGVSIAPLITALGVGGLAVGLALQPTLENVFSGIQVLASGQIEPGNLIRLETGEEGSVLDVTWRNTTILTPSNDVVIVPNAIIGRSRVTNFSALSPEHVLVVPVTVSAQADVAAVERCLREVAEEVARETEGAVHELQPTTRFVALTPAGLQMSAAIRVESYPARLGVRHEFIKRLQTRFVAEGIDAAQALAPALSAPAGG